MTLTIGAWVLFTVAAFFLIGGGIFFGYGIDDEVRDAIIGALIGILLSVALLFGFNWYFTHTEAGARDIKTQESNLGNGIERRVEVYDATGNLVKTYEGKFDIEYDDDRILFDDEKGLRHIIYYPTGTICIDEVGE